MFGFLDMIGNYNQRVVANNKCPDFEVDTAAVTDTKLPYETAVRHKRFNHNGWIVLEWAATKEEALQVHNKWVKYFTDNKNIETLTDIYYGTTYKRQGGKQ